MSVKGIENAVQQMLATAQLTGQVDKTPDVASVGNFAGELRSAIDRISGMQNEARTQAQNFGLGVPGIALNDVMVDLQKSGIALQMGIQVRNKLVTAYQEVMNMPV